MKTIQLHIKAFASFGTMAAIALLMGIVLIIAAINHMVPAFGIAQERMNLINTLEGHMGQDLNQMLVRQNQVFFAIQYRLPAKEDVDRAMQSEANIRQLLNELEALGVFSPKPNEPLHDMRPQVNNFKNALTRHQNTFNNILRAARENPNLDWPRQLGDLEKQRGDLNDGLRNLIIAAEQDRMAAIQQLPEQVNRSILVITYSIMICLLLGLMGYRVITTTVRPFRHLRNMITSIGGDQYRTSMYQDLIEKGGQAGNLAQALDTLAKGEQERNAEAKQKIEALQQELLESRRKRLRLYRESESAE